MTQVPLGAENRATEVDRDDGTHEVTPDVAYLRTMIVNVVFYGLASAGDRNWTLIDAGVIGSKALIKSAAAKRFGETARPSAIVMTHGHFDHVGVLEDLASEWDVPVYAHPLEHPYLNGRAAYPSGDPSVGGGLMAALGPLYPTKPVDVSSHLVELPMDGSVPPMPGWRWLHTPGHAPGHISLWREADRTMIVGDAFVTTKQESVYAALTQSPEMHGPPQYFTIDWNAAKASVEKLAALKPNLVVAGHGRAMQGAQMTQALEKLAREFFSVAVPKQGRYVDHPATVQNGEAYQKP